MSEVCTLLVWARPQLAVFSADAMRSKFQPGEVVDVQPGVFFFGRDIAKLGHWRVIVCDGPHWKAHGLMAGDPVNAERPNAPRRLRTRRIDLEKVGDRCTFAELWAATTEVPKPVDETVIGLPRTVIG